MLVVYTTADLAMSSQCCSSNTQRRRPGALLEAWPVTNAEELIT